MDSVHAEVGYIEISRGVWREYIAYLAECCPLDKACIDMVLNSEDHGKEHLIERINSRNGTLTIEAAEKHGLGSQNYKLVTLED